MTPPLFSIIALRRLAGNWVIILENKMTKEYLSLSQKGSAESMLFITSRASSGSALPESTDGLSQKNGSNQWLNLEKKL